MYLLSVGELCLDFLRMGMRNLTLNHLLTIRGLTGRDLARRLDTTESTVSRWRRGLEPSPAMKRRLAEVLELTDAELDALGWREAVHG